MKVTFKVFGLEEKRFLTGATLSSGGIREDDEMIVVRKHQADFDSMYLALAYVSACKHAFEHGFEIVEAYTTNHPKN